MVDDFFRQIKFTCKAFALAVCLLFAYTSQAQILPDSVVVDSMEVENAFDEILFKEDSINLNFYSLPANLEFIPGNDDPILIADRLSCIQNQIPLIYNDKVHSFINFFTVKDRAYTNMIIQRMNLYFPLFEKYLKEYGLPDELKYLSIIESGLNPKAVSRARAVGLWQFMAATGRYFDLHVDFYQDDRMDPEKATIAACRYLKQLYTIFGDWELALAAYNSGPGNVKRAIKRAGNKKSFWDIYKYVPRETRSYVPQFVAITYTMNYLKEHNFIFENQYAYPSSDTIQIKKYLHLPTFANLTQTCSEDIALLNPNILQYAIPDVSKPFVLRVPIASKKAFDANRSFILDSASRVGKKELEILAKNSPGSTYGKDKVVYKVKSGDVLGSIAIRYNVRVADIKKWNNLRSNTIRVGQRLNIWLKPAAIKKDSISQTLPMPLQGDKTYVVQEGDTLWSISKKFDGLTIEKIKSLNKLENSRIQPGQKLILGQ